MRKTILAILGVCVCLISVVGCKTNEKNYREAYEKAKERYENGGGIDSTIYARYRNAARESKMVISGDTMAIRTQYVTLSEDQGYAEFRRYNIVMGEFKQIFNAKSMRDRLYAAGYPNTYIVQTREPLYLVVAASTNMASDALHLLQKAKSEPPFVLREPCPYVLQVAQMAR